MANVKMNRYLKKILRKMCSYTRCPFKEEYFMEKDWYLNYSWTESEQEEFRVWLVDYLSKNKIARYELAGYPLNNKELLNKFSTMFLFNYGWKVNDEKI